MLTSTMCQPQHIEVFKWMIHRPLFYDENIIFLDQTRKVPTMTTTVVRQNVPKKNNFELFSMKSNTLWSMLMKTEGLKMPKLITKL